jgi:hypothetical protein
MQGSPLPLLCKHKLQFCGKELALQLSLLVQLDWKEMVARVWVQKLMKCRTPRLITQPHECYYSAGIRVCFLVHWLPEVDFLKQYKDKIFSWCNLSGPNFFCFETLVIYIFPLKKRDHVP